MSILLLGFDQGTFTEPELAQIHEIVPDMQIMISEDRSEIEGVLDEIEIAVRGFPRDLMSKASNLRWFHHWYAGINWLHDYPEVLEKDFIITNASGVHAISISEHILGFLLAFGRGLNVEIRAQEQHIWRQLPSTETFELFEKTMLIVGLGAIGAQTAKLASAFGIRVLGIRRHPEIPTSDVEAVYGTDRLPDILPQVDFVVTTAPWTKETEKMFGEREFRAMKSTAYFVNIGRGKTVDEQAMIRALQEGWIAGAGLDVFETEPLPEDSPLWDMENVIITAHYSGATPRYHERAFEILLENLKRYQAGTPLMNVIDKTLGY